ncbi:hypothetical protein L1887_35640 [Cichorium endivia]|nr:hypothetical protein L1887_35640 [Cichorium endivia]
MNNSTIWREKRIFQSQNHFSKFHVCSSRCPSPLSRSNPPALPSPEFSLAQSSVRFFAYFGLCASCVHMMDSAPSYQSQSVDDLIPTFDIFTLLIGKFKFGI